MAVGARHGEVLFHVVGRDLDNVETAIVDAVDRQRLVVEPGRDVAGTRIATNVEPLEVDAIHPGQTAAGRGGLAVGEHGVPDAAVEAEIAKLELLSGPVHDHDLRVCEVAASQDQRQQRAQSLLRQRECYRHSAFCLRSA